MIGFDLDGTLLNSSSIISEYTLLKIHEAMEKGTKVTICSGRIPAMQEMFVAQIGFSGTYAASNGAVILHSDDFSLIYDNFIENETIKKLCQFADREKIHICIQTMERLYYSRNNPRKRLAEVYNFSARKYGYSEVSIQNLDMALDDRIMPAYKVMLYAQGKDQFEKIENFLNQEPLISYTFSMNYLFDIMNKGINKGKGIKKIAGYYNIPLEEVCVFGDHYNDIPMFKAAGLSIAMGNAVDSLKEIADFVIDDNDSEGIGKAIDALMGLV